MPITGTEASPLVRTPIPGPKARAIIRRDEAHMLTTTKTAPLVGHAARGCVVEDVDGNRLLDFASGIGVLNTGHCHPKVVAAVQEQAARMMHFAGTDFYYDAQASLAERLTRLAPVAGKSKVFYCQSGTEANEAAIKLAKSGTGRPLFLSFLGSFHGRTQGSLALTASKTKHRAGFFGMMGGVAHAPFPNPYRNVWRIDGYADPAELTNRALDYIDGLLDTILPPQDVAGLFWEPVQGEGGYVVPPRQFPPALRKLCDQHGMQLVADEVQTGFGRTGKMFAAEHYGVEADIVTLAKAMGSGFPIGAAVARAELDFEEKGRHSNTYGGNPVGCAAGLATLDVIQEEKLVANSARMGERMGRQLDEMTEGHARVGDHRGLGLMRALEFVAKDGAPDPKLRDAVEKEAWKRGLITLGCGRSSLRFIPPLTITAQQVDGGMEVLRQALKAAKA
ncbi:MAG TPA: acetyl ornithine aminotransferase family protein [Candidatus Thermoplasmatota archaeon]|nr:acetyl ornithine aminotransferase family protein [Candidatus Thermoplasmatota archaeon]